MPKIRVLIADDHALVREGLISLLAHYDDIDVIGEASDGIEAIKHASELKPDIILMDIGMPKLGGLEATLEIKKTCPDVKIIVLTQYDDREYVSRFLKAGVSGYLLKRAVGSQLINAIRAVEQGEFYLFSSITAEVIDGYLGRDVKKAAENSPYDKLTDREKQILKLVAEGMSHKEIAGELDISVKTVITHQSHISQKLNIHSRTALIKYAIANGIIKLET